MGLNTLSSEQQVGYWGPDPIPDLPRIMKKKQKVNKKFTQNEINSLFQLLNNARLDRRPLYVDYDDNTLITPNISQIENSNSIISSDKSINNSIKSPSLQLHKPVTNKDTKTNKSNPSTPYTPFMQRQLKQTDTPAIQSSSWQPYDIEDEDQKEEKEKQYRAILSAISSARNNEHDANPVSLKSLYPRAKPMAEGGTSQTEGGTTNTSQNGTTSRSSSTVNGIVTGMNIATTAINTANAHTNNNDDEVSGSLSTPTGNAIAGVGAVVGGIVSCFYPAIGAIISGATALIGAGVNAGWGHNENINRPKRAFTNKITLNSSTGSNEDLLARQAQNYSITKGKYKNGWFTNKGKDIVNAYYKQTQTQQTAIQKALNQGAMNNLFKQYASASKYPYGGVVNTSLFL